MTCWRDVGSRDWTQGWEKETRREKMFLLFSVCFSFTWSSRRRRWRGSLIGLEGRRGRKIIYIAIGHIIHTFNRDGGGGGLERKGEGVDLVKVMQTRRRWILFYRESCSFLCWTAYHRRRTHPSDMRRDSLYFIYIARVRCCRTR